MDREGKANVGHPFATGPLHGASESPEPKDEKEITTFHLVPFTQYLLQGYYES